MIAMLVRSKHQLPLSGGAGFLKVGDNHLPNVLPWQRRELDDFVKAGICEVFEDGETPPPVERPAVAPPPFVDEQGFSENAAATWDAAAKSEPPTSTSPVSVDIPAGADPYDGVAAPIRPDHVALNGTTPPASKAPRQRRVRRQAGNA